MAPCQITSYHSCFAANLNRSLVNNDLHIIREICAMLLGYSRIPKNVSSGETEASIVLSNAKDAKTVRNFWKRAGRVGQPE